MEKSVKRNNKQVKNALRLLLLIICGAILGFNVYSANANGLVGNRLPMPLGVGSAIVLSGSMEPELSKGDLIIVKQTEEFAVDDVVVYQTGDELVVHRIVGIYGQTVTTKGDANNVSDEPIDISDIKGKVLFGIPYLGILVDLIKTPIGTLVILAAAIALIEIPRRREKREDDEKREQIIEEIERLKRENNN